MRVGCQHQALAALAPEKSPLTRFERDWVGFGAGLDGYGKSRPHGGSSPWPSNPW
jgi:hypothetical protein